jgi:FkbM family methyltransferase
MRDVTWGAIQWKFRQKYSQFRSRLGGGHHFWSVEPGIRFVARSDDAFSHVLFVCGGHEVTEMQWSRRWLGPGDSLIDCGANSGYFSAYLAQSCCLERIVAVEGNHRTASICADNMALLGITNITVVEAILSANDKERLIISDAPGREPWQRATEPAPNASGATVTTLDVLSEQYQLKPSLVKIDCEGFEPLILKGATRLLTADRPAFMVECNDEALHAANANRLDLFSIFRENDYALFHLASFGADYPFGISCDEKFPAKEFNFAAIPNEPSGLERWKKSSSALLAKFG